MTPPARDHITWSIIGRATIGALIAWAAYEFREMRSAVYNGQTKSAVLETRVEGLDTRVKRIEAKLYKEQ